MSDEDAVHRLDMHPVRAALYKPVLLGGVPWTVFVLNLLAVIGFMAGLMFGGFPLIFAIVLPIGQAIAIHRGLKWFYRDDPLTFAIYLRALTFNQLVNGKSVPYFPGAVGSRAVTPEPKRWTR